MTLMGAVEYLRSRGQLPTSGVISTRALLQSFPPAPPRSMRALLLKMFESAEKLPWAVILCRFKGFPGDRALEDPVEQFFREAFKPGTGGLVEYWRDVSLGAIDITGSHVFGWVEVDIPREKAGGTPTSVPPGPGRSGLIDAAIRAVQQSGADPSTNFHCQIAVYTQNWSKDGAPADADWRTPGWFQYWIDGSADGRGKVCLTPPFNGNVTAHEMGHGFGMGHDVGSDLTTATDYSDPCCIMSQNGPFNHPRWGRPFGPAICLPHLAQKNWMYGRRVYYDSGGWKNQPNGITVPLAPISRPIAHANLGIRLAYADKWDYWLEYVIPAEWNQGVPGSPYLFIRRIASTDGGERPAYLGAIGIGRTTEFIEPSGNVRFRAELTTLPGPILKVNATKL